MKQIIFKTRYLKDPHLFYQANCHHSNTIILESAEIVDKSGIQSLIGVSCAVKVKCNNLKVTAEALNKNGSALITALGEKIGVRTDGILLSVQYQRADGNLDEETRLKAPGPFDVIRVLRELIKDCTDMFISGNIAFDFINNFENLGEIPDGINPCSDFCFYFFDVSIRVDHINKDTSVNAYCFSGQQYEKIALAALKLRDTIECFEQEDTLVLNRGVKPSINPDIDDRHFAEIVSKIREHIVNGDAFQVVPSRTFSAPCPDPLLAYSYLKKLNPSPYMYYIKDPLFTIFGASPEFAVRVDEKTREVSISPIAGTRARGLNPDGTLDRELDSRIELELRTDTKEVSEHMMLVDLARNDLARIAKPGTRYVDNLLHVDKYQSVMHLVSDVHAELRDDLDCFHAYLACMNMGTLSGAPKIKAHQLIYKYEGKKRGSYGGVVVNLKSDGSFDSCIAIRSAFVRDGTAYVQAGCGVVYDSNPQAECQETVNKARSVLSALTMAQEN